MDQRVDVDVVARLGGEADTVVGVVNARVERDVVGGLQQNVGRCIGQQIGIDFTVGARGVGESRHVAQRGRRAGEERGDEDIRRVQLPEAGRPVGRARIDSRACHIQEMPGRLDKTALARGRPTACRQRAIDPRRVIAPDDDLAAIATGQRIGGNPGILAHITLLGIQHSRVLALVVTAHQHPATAALATGVDARIAHHTDLLAQHLDITAVINARGGGGAAGFEQGAAAGLEHYLAAGSDYGAVGIQRAALVDQGAIDANVAALGDHRAQVQRLVFLRRHHHMHARVAGVDQLHRVPRRQHRFALRCGDDAAVVHIRRNQIHLATRRRRDRALVAHLAGRPVGGKAPVTGEKVGVGNRQARRDQATDIDLGTATEHDAVRVDQVHPPVGL